MWKHCMPVGEWYFGDVHREIEHFILKLYYVKDSGFKKRQAKETCWRQIIWKFRGANIQ